MSGKATGRVAAAFETPGQRLGYARERANMTGDEVVTALGFTKRRWVRWERSARYIRTGVQVMPAACLAVNADYEWVVFGQGPFKESDCPAKTRARILKQCRNARTCRQLRAIHAPENVPHRATGDRPQTNTCPVGREIGGASLSFLCYTNSFNISTCPN